MGKPSRMQAIEIISIDRDSFGLFAKVRLEFSADEQLLIRWGLDETTYENLFSALSSNPFSTDPTPSRRLRYFLVANQEIHTRNGYHVDVLCTLDPEETLVRVPCTELFVCNLHWLQAVKDLKDVENLAFDAAPQRPRNFKSNDRKWRRVLFFTTIASLVILVIGASAVIVYTGLHKNPPSLFMKPVTPSAHSHRQTTQRIASTTTAASTRDVLQPLMSFSTPHSQPLQKRKDDTLTVSVPQVYELPKGEVAITIDDGPSPYTEDLVRTLHKYGVVATFFFVGNRVKDWPTAVQDAVANGDEIGDHSLSHPVLARLSLAKQRQQIVQGARDIQQYDPHPICLFRPPYESFNQDTERILAQEHMALALWNRDPRDWAATSGQEVVDRVIHGNPSGGVFDMHENPNTLAALPKIIKTLKAQHLKFVTLTPPKGYTGIQPLTTTGQ